MQSLHSRIPVATSRGLFRVSAEDGKTSLKAQETLKALKEKFQVPTPGYTAGLAPEQLAMLNRRERSSLDIQHAVLCVTRLTRPDCSEFRSPGAFLFPFLETITMTIYDYDYVIFRFSHVGRIGWKKTNDCMLMMRYELKHLIYSSEPFGTVPNYI